MHQRQTKKGALPRAMLNRCSDVPIANEEVSNLGQLRADIYRTLKGIIGVWHASLRMDSSTSHTTMNSP
jgi:hypothetical protein